MKIFSSLLLILCTAYTCSAQAPGGVKNPVLWKTAWEQRSELDYGEKKFNYHPYQYFDEDRDYNEFTLSDLNRISLFMVFSSENKSDIVDLTLSNAKVLFKDDEVISKQEILYEKEEGLPALLTYIEAFPKPNSIPNGVPSFLIGSKTIEDKWFEGGVAEIVLYDRLISREQRRKVESYLSLKYGVSLADSLDYYSSDGTKIWEYSKEGNFNNRLTAIGKDVEGGLNQKQSHNLHDDFSLTLAVGGQSKMNKSNTAEINDKSFLMWADDNKTIELIEDTKQTNQIKTIDRKWKITKYGKGWSEKKVQVIIDPSNLQGYAPELNFWMILNNSNFNELNQLHKNQLIPMSNEEDGTYSAFVNFDQDISGADYFTFIQAPDQFISMDITDMDCNSKGGDIALYLHGFNASTSDYYLENGGKEFTGVWNKDSNSLSFNNFPFGNYTLRERAENIALDQLSFSQENCNESFAWNTSLYPNPVSTGDYFTIELPQDRVEKLSLEIHDLLGRIILKQNIDPNDSYTFSTKILSEGTYNVSLKSGQNKVVRKLVVVNK